MKNWRLVVRGLVRPVENQDGAALIFFGLLVLALLAFFSLGVDVGAALNARSEAQRAADAAALAGAGMFMMPGEPLVQQPTAEDTARHFASINAVSRWMIDPANDVTVTFPGDPSERRIGVEVRGNVPSLFSSLLGFNLLPVKAYAEAWAAPAAGAKCVKPWALPDMWDERSSANGNLTQDLNGNRVWEPPTGNNPNAPGEAWSFDPGVDRYQKWTGDALQDANATGYGSGWRDNQPSGIYGDQGRYITIKPGAPGGSPNCETCTPNTDQIYPGNFLAFRLPADSTMPNPDQTTGGALYRNNIAHCNLNTISFDTPYDLEPGNMGGPTRQGLDDLIGTGANRDNSTFEQAMADPEGTRRAIKVALYDPVEVQSSGGGEITLNNIAWFYIDDYTNQGEVTGRFMFYAEGVGVGEGSTVKTLQLIK